jgi:hypothetical protein
MEKMQTVIRKKANVSTSLSPVDFEKARIEHAQARKEETRLLGEVAQRKHEAGIAEQVTPAPLRAQHELALRPCPTGKIL